MTEDFINLPVEYKWSSGEIYQEYARSGNKKSICRQFCITIAELNKIIKTEEKE
ncbi:hypothetical protein [Enterocloster citroniae]|uniref:Uncharacterized protein n=1 Tax=[Clostridium] citroniae WAL-17108 TaxID=742733 RepID=G5HE72_9FIRM|nr:hypothetical protein [Enterocloster citroniae]EHF00299.1 hypothetical protein HMPREF9469_00884 [ [[Clostridium] citroniae WAL-17108]